MGAIPWWAWVLLAVLFFWMLGAHNRVVGRRPPSRTPGGPGGAPQPDRRPAPAPRRAAVDPRLPNEQAALDAVSNAQALLLQAGNALGSRPTDPAGAESLARAEAALAPALVRLSSLIEQHADWRDEPDVAGPLATLRELAPRWQFVRQMYNDAATAYNAAIRQFPTRLLTRVFRFTPAGSF